MKKLIVAVIFAVFFVVAAAVFAQNNNPQEKTEGEVYYKNISLEKIYPYRNGYVVQYRQGFVLARTYLPMEWFISSAGKGEIITLSKGTGWPSLSVFYRDGEFSHVRLYVHHSPSHQTWGVIPQNINLDDRFENIEKLDIKY
ncbi:MAG: hypothetical protein LBG95_06630 [Treponema sp.]|nr:hypothetical protein [Treponema sp.]